MDELETSGATEVVAEESTTTPATQEVEKSEPAQDNSIRANLEREMQRERDESGRFAKKQEQKASDQSDTITKQTEPAQPIIPLPVSWSADKKELFKTLPRDLQEYILQRDKETTTKIGQASERAARYEKWEPIEKEVGTVLADKLKRMGLSPHDAVKALVNAQAEMDRNPLPTLQKIARSYGLLPGGNPQQSAVTPELAALRQEFQQIKSDIQQQKSAQVEAQLKTLESTVAEWSKGKEHYDLVWESMGHYLPLFAGKMSHAEALDKAYAHAIHDRPEISQALAQKAEATKIQEAKAKADKARRAGSSLPSSSSNSTTQLPKSDRRGMLAALFDEKI